MFGHNKSRLVLRSSPEIHGERMDRSAKKKHSLAHEFDIIFTKINNLREWTKSFIKDSIALVGTETDMDIKSYLNDSEKKHLGKTKLEILGTDMIHAAKSSGVKGGIYGKALLKVGECEKRLGSYTRDFVVDVCSSFIRPLKYFMDVELNKLLEEKEMLTSRKIDYDYHVRQVSNSRADKNSHHKLKMAEMALEFQYVHAKEILHGIEVSECQVGHLSDLISVQSVYHQKCLAELEKLKSELKRMSNDSNEKTDGNSVLDSTTKVSSSKVKKKVENLCSAETQVPGSKRLENRHEALGDSKIVDSKISQERFQTADRTKLDKLPIDSGEDDDREEVQEKRNVRGGSNIRPDQNRKSESQVSTTPDVKFPQKVSSSIVPCVDNKRMKFERIHEDLISRPFVHSPQGCSNHKPPSFHSAHSSLKVCSKPPVNPSCLLYSGDHSRGSSTNKDGYTSDDSTTSKETHVIPIPVRSNYRRDVGKMFFTPCKDLE